MKRRTLLAVLFILVTGLGLACAKQTLAIRNAETNRPNLTPVSLSPVNSNYTLSGPHSHANLTVFLIHSQSQASGNAPLTLQEAMERKKVVVHETGNVNELAIENNSDEEVYVQSGDIVKGGQQDRVLAIDLIVPPRSGRIPIASFCVEQGRWSARDGDARTAFSSSDHALNAKELKIAAKSKKDQGEVWRNVSQSQEKLNSGLRALSAPQTAAGGGGGADAVPTQAVTERVEVRAGLSASSLQLSLENSKLKDVSGDYIKALSEVINNKPDVIGFAFAINGKLNSADVYASHSLFIKLWPKLLKASAIEAIAEYRKDERFEAVTTDTVIAFLREAEGGKAEQKELTQRVLTIKRETDKNLFFETRDRTRGDLWLHRNYLVK